MVDRVELVERLAQFVLIPVLYDGLRLVEVLDQIDEIGGCDGVHLCFDGLAHRCFGVVAQIDGVFVSNQRALVQPGHSSLETRMLTQRTPAQSSRLHGILARTCVLGRIFLPLLGFLNFDELLKLA